MNKIILVGKAAAGKDHMRRILSGRGFEYGISYTTRPPREGEIDGKDYFFLSVEEFKKKIKEEFWYEWIEFNGWYYGTSYRQFMHTCNLFIMTPKGISHIDPVDRKECTIIYLNVDEKIRRGRLEEREMPGDSIDRRMEADDLDFKDFTDFDIEINNSNF